MPIPIILIIIASFASGMLVGENQHQIVSVVTKESGK